MDASSDEREPVENPDARYANYFEVGHNAFEFLLEFGQMYDGEPASIHTRIVTGPYYAKAFLALFQAAMDAFDQKEPVQEPHGEL
jgi:hypothetical protein